MRLSHVSERHQGADCTFFCRNSQSATEHFTAKHVTAFIFSHLTGRSHWRGMDDTNYVENDADHRADPTDPEPKMILMTLIMIPMTPKTGLERYHVILIGS